MNDEWGSEDQVLWELLERVERPTASPYFSRRVMREIRGEASATRTGWLRWLMPAAAAASLALLFTTATRPSTVEMDEAFAVAAGFETLLATSSGWAWPDVIPAAP